MKQGLLLSLACCSLWCTSASAATPNPYQAGFSDGAKMCERVAAANPSDNSDTSFSAASCYRYQVQTAIVDSKSCAIKGARANRCASFAAQFDKQVQKSAKTDLVAAAVQAAPHYIAETVQAALQSGMDSGQVVQVATAAYPDAEATIAQQAITFGADPTVVLNATAAGKANGYQYDPDKGFSRKEK
jgi:hypothetical protein